MQIISGKYRGRKLAIPPTARPTQNRARIALFNILMGIGGWGSGTVVWDAFAGSGAFGLECISRFDARVIFTDISPDSIKTIKKNLDGINSPQSSIPNTQNAITAIPRHGPIADLIFIDPPYDSPDLGAEFIRKLTPGAKLGAIVIWEMDKVQEIPDFAGMTLLKDKTYGRARFLILQKII